MASTVLSSPPIHPDTQAVLLLCGTFARENDPSAKPLTLTEYNVVASWLSRQGKRPANVLQDPHELLSAEEPSLPARERLRALLNRGFLMAAALERWQRLALWVLSRGEECYPERLRRTLRAHAPALLFGAGDRDRLQRGGLAIVGSRALDEEGFAFTQRVAEHCAAQGVQVISGGAKGVDRAAVAATLEAGGNAVTVLADRLDRTATSREARELLREGRLTLVTPYEPDATFTIGRVMGRNKIVYGLADHALVVRFATQEGGTWAGAVEQLGRNKSAAIRVPVFVRLERNPQAGCMELLSRGACVFPEEQFWHARVGEVLDQAVPPLPPVGDCDAGEQAAMALSQPKDSSVPTAPSEAGSCYQHCLPLLLQKFQHETNAKQLAQIGTQLDLLPKQLEAWLKRAIAEGKLAKKKKTGRVVYQATVNGSEKSLFDSGGDAA
jgi:predicted Rossmann fold nucleotide-binding protein DprA/Smf involved in DNA uptake